MSLTQGMKAKQLLATIRTKPIRTLEKQKKEATWYVGLLL